MLKACGTSWDKDAHGHRDAERTPRSATVMMTAPCLACSGR